MSLKEDVIKALTPKDTDEVKPNLFIQTLGNPDSLIDRLEKTVVGKRIKYPYYRQIWPGAWNGRIKKYNLILGGRFIGTTLWFLIIMFLAYSYYHDVNQLQQFYILAHNNPSAICTYIPGTNLSSDLPQIDFNNSLISNAFRTSGLPSNP